MWFLIDLGYHDVLPPGSAMIIINRIDNPAFFSDKVIHFDPKPVGSSDLNTKKKYVTIHINVITVWGVRQLMGMWMTGGRRTKQMLTEPYIKKRWQYVLSWIIQNDFIFLKCKLFFRSNYSTVLQAYSHKVFIMKRLIYLYRIGFS